MIFRKPKQNLCQNPCSAIVAEANAIKAPRVKTPGLLSRFRRDSGGSVAIEFGILVVPFMALIFAILESCLSFTAQQVMANVTDKVGREIRTGELRAPSEAQVKGLICARLKVLVEDTCSELEIDLKQYPNFQSVPTRIPFTGSGDINTAGFTTNAGGASTINQLRVFYRWPVMTDFMRSQLSNMPGNKTLLYSSATWRNESFD